MQKLRKASSLKLLFQFPKYKDDLLGFMESLIHDYGDAIEFRLGNFKGLFLNKPEYYKYVMLENWSNFPKSDRYKVFSPLIGDSILSANGPRWKFRRTLIQPLLSTKKIKVFDEPIQKTIQGMIHGLDKQEQINISQMMSQITFKLICRLSFSGDIEEKFDEFSNLVHTLAKESKDRAITPFLFLNKAPLPRNFKYRNLSSRAHQIVDQIIHHRIENPSNEVDLLSLMLTAKDEEGNKLSLVDLRHELTTLLIAGNDTTALSLSWALYELAQPKNKSIQEEVFEEVRSILQKGQIATGSLITQMPKLKKFTDEALRLYPAVWLYTRQAKEDDNICGVPVKKGTTVLLAPYFLHRHPDYWKTPDLFDLNRKNDEDRFRFSPFAHGPRGCAGKWLAYMELYMILASLINHYQFTSEKEDQVKPKALLNLYPSKNIYLKATIRD